MLQQFNAKHRVEFCSAVSPYPFLFLPPSSCYTGTPLPPSHFFLLQHQPHLPPSSSILECYFSINLLSISSPSTYSYLPTEPTSRNSHAQPGLPGVHGNEWMKVIVGRLPHRIAVPLTRSIIIRYPPHAPQAGTTNDPHLPPQIKHQQKVWLPLSSPASISRYLPGLLGLHPPPISRSRITATSRLLGRRSQ